MARAIPRTARPVKSIARSRQPDEACWPMRSHAPTPARVAAFRRCANIDVRNACANTEGCAWNKRSPEVIEKSAVTYEDKLRAYHGCMPVDELKGLRRAWESIRARDPRKSAVQYPEALAKHSAVVAIRNLLEKGNGYTREQFEELLVDVQTYIELRADDEDQPKIERYYDYFKHVYGV